MNITSAKYHKSYDVNVSVNATIDGIEMIIPMDNDNRHYEAILKWVAAGNTINAAD